MNDKTVKLVVGLFVAALMAAFLLPIAIGAVTDPDTVTQTQDVGETITLQGDLTATLDAVNDNTNATYTVANDADSVSTTVNEGATNTITVDGHEVSVTLDSTTATTATTTYEWPITYGWGSAASSLWLVLPILMVLSIFLFFVGMAINRT